MSTALVVKSEPQGLSGWESKHDLIKRTVAKGATDDELEIFLHQCRKTGLDPLAKQIYFQKRKNRKTGEETMTIITGIDGYRLVADRTGKYAGNDDPVYEPLDAKIPEKATVTVYKVVAGLRCAFTASARWTQYCPEFNNFLWLKMPHLMLGKCAEALALRKAFPAELSGVYTAEEMEQADQPLVNNAPKAPHLKSHVEGQADEVVRGVVTDVWKNENGNFYKVALKEGGEKTCFTKAPLLIGKLAGVHGLFAELLTHEFKVEDDTFNQINGVIGIEVEDEAVDGVKSNVVNGISTSAGTNGGRPSTRVSTLKSELETKLSASLQQVAAHEAGVPANGAEAAYNDETGRAAGVVAKVFPAVGRKPLGITLAGVNFSTFDKVQRKRLENSAGHYVVLTYVLKDGKYRNIVDVEKCGGIDYRNSLAGTSEVPSNEDIPF